MVFRRCFTLFLTSITLPLSLASNLQAQMSWVELSEKAQSELIEAAYCRVTFGFNDSLTLTRLKVQRTIFEASEHKFFLKMIAAACNSTTYATAITEITTAMTQRYNIINALNRHYQQITTCNSYGEISVRTGYEEEAKQIQKNLEFVEDTKKIHELDLKAMLRDALIIAFNAQDADAEEE